MGDKEEVSIKEKNNVVLTTAGWIVNHTTLVPYIIE